MPEKTKKRGRLFICLLWPLAVIALLALSYGLWLPQTGYMLVVSDPLEKADAIIPLGGGDPRRFIVAARLYDDGWAPLVVTTGELVPDYLFETEEQRTLAELGAELVVAKGVPRDKVHVLNKGTSTYDEAFAVKKLCEEKKFSKIIVVTTIFHTRRTRAVYRKAFEGSGIGTVIRPAEGGMYRTDEWWTREEDLIFVNNEWIKSILYLLQGKM